MNTVPELYYTILNSCRDNYISQAETALKILLRNASRTVGTGELQKLFRLCFFMLKAKKIDEVRMIFTRLVRGLTAPLPMVKRRRSFVHNAETIVAARLLFGGADKTVRLMTGDPVIAERMRFINGRLLAERMPNGARVWSIVIEPYQLQSTAAFLQIPQYLEWFNQYVSGQLTIDF